MKIMQSLMLGTALVLASVLAGCGGIDVGGNPTPPSPFLALSVSGEFPAKDAVAVPINLVDLGELNLDRQIAVYFPATSASGAALSLVASTIEGRFHVYDIGPASSEAAPPPVEAAISGTELSAESVAVAARDGQPVIVFTIAADDPNLGNGRLLPDHLYGARIDDGVLAADATVGDPESCADDAPPASGCYQLENAYEWTFATPPMWRFIDTVLDQRFNKVVALPESRILASGFTGGALAESFVTMFDADGDIIDEQIINIGGLTYITKMSVQGNAVYGSGWGFVGAIQVMWIGKLTVVGDTIVLNYSRIIPGAYVTYDMAIDEKNDRICVVGYEADVPNPGESRAAVFLFEDTGAAINPVDQWTFNGVSSVAPAGDGVNGLYSIAISSDGVIFVSGSLTMGVGNLDFVVRRYDSYAAFDDPAVYEEYSGDVVLGTSGDALFSLVLDEEGDRLYGAGWRWTAGNPESLMRSFTMDLTYKAAKKSNVLGGSGGFLDLIMNDEGNLIAAGAYSETAGPDFDETGRFAVHMFSPSLLSLKYVTDYKPYDADPSKGAANALALAQDTYGNIVVGGSYGNFDFSRPYRALIKMDRNLDLITAAPE